MVLLAHEPQGLRRRSNKGNLRCLANLGEIRVLGEKSIARMYGVDVGDLGGADHVGDIQITVGAACRSYTYGFVGKAHVQSIAVRFRINRHRGDIQFLARTDHTQGDFTTIRYQYLAEHRGKPRPLLLLGRTDGE